MRLVQLSDYRQKAMLSCRRTLKQKHRVDQNLLVNINPLSEVIPLGILKSLKTLNRNNSISSKALIFFVIRIYQVSFINLLIITRIKLYTLLQNFDNSRAIIKSSVISSYSLVGIGKEASLLYRRQHFAFIHQYTI